MILESTRGSSSRRGRMSPTSIPCELTAGAIVVGTSGLLDAPGRRWAAQAQFGGLDAVVAVLNPIGSGVTLLGLCVGLAIVGRTLGRSRVSDAEWLGALAFMGAGLVEYVLKHLVGRPRPAVGGALLGPELDSFPSGHATSVFTVATALGAFYPRVRWALYALAATIALGRVYRHRHYASDVVAGALIGLVIASLTLRHRRVTVAAASTRPSTRIRPVAPFSCT